MASAAVVPTGSNNNATKFPPNQSLYIQNLPEKLQKYDLKRELYMLFSAYGAVIDVTAVKDKRMRGQAHVLFRDIPTATQAMRHCQGFDFFGREMRISYAKSRSHTLAKLTGKFYDDKVAEQAKAAEQNKPQSSILPSGGPVPVPGLSGPPGGAAPPPGLPPKPQTAAHSLPPPPGLPNAAASPAGMKRAREESDEEDEAEESEDEGAAMDMDEDD